MALLELRIKNDPTGDFDKFQSDIKDSILASDKLLLSVEKINRQYSNLSRGTSSASADIRKFSIAARSGAKTTKAAATEQDKFVDSLERQAAALRDSVVASQRGQGGLKEYQAALAGASERAKPLVEEIKKLEKLQKQSRASAVAKEYKKLAASLPEASEELKKINDELKDSATASGRAGASLDRLSASTGALKIVRSQIKALHAELRVLPSGSSRAKKALDELARAEIARGNLVGQVRKLKKELNGVGLTAAGIANLNWRLSHLSNNIKNFSSVLGGLEIFKAIGRTAFSFNSVLEDSQIGIAALVRQFSKDLPDGADKYARSMAVAESAQKKLQIEGLKTTATYSELLRAFQEGAGPALAAGFSTDELVLFTSDIAKVAGTLKQPLDQLGQEIRTIFEFKIDKNARIGKALQLDSGTLKAWAEAGTLFENLRGRMSNFAEAGDALSRTFAGALSNLGDAVQTALGTGTEKIFEGTTKGILSLTDAIVQIDEKTGTFTFSKEITESLAKVDTSISEFIASITAEDLSSYIATTANTARSVLEALLSLAQGGKAVLDGLGPALPVMAKLGTYLIAIGGPIAATTAALSFFVGSASGLITVFTTIKAAALGLAPAITGVGASAGFASAAMLPLVAVITATGVALYGAVKAYRSMREAQEQASKASARASAGEAKFQKTLEKISKETGIVVTSYSEMRAAFAESGIEYDKATDRYVTGAQAARIEQERLAATTIKNREESEKLAQTAEQTAAKLKQYGESSGRLIELGDKIRLLKVQVKAFSAASVEGRAALARLSAANIEKAGLTDQVKRLKKELKGVSVEAGGIAGAAPQLETALSETGQAASGAAKSIGNLRTEAGAVGNAQVNGLNNSLDQTRVKAEAAGQAVAGIGTGEISGPSAPEGGAVSYTVGLDLTEYNAKVSELQEDIRRINNDYQVAINFDSSEADNLKKSLQEAKEELANTENIKKYNEELRGLWRTFRETKLELLDGKLTIDTDPEASKELQKQIGKVNALKFATEGLIPTVEYVDGVWKNVSPSMQAAKEAVDSVSDSSGNLNTEWREINGTWQEVLPDGTLLVDHMTASIQKGTEAAGRLGSSIADTAVTGNLADADAIINKIGNSLDKTARKAGSVKLERLADSITAVGAVEARIKGLKATVDELGPASEGGRAALSKLLKAEAVKSELQNKITGLKKEIYSTGEEAERTGGKAKDAARDISAIGSETATAAAGVKKLAEANNELAESTKGASSSTGKFFITVDNSIDGINTRILSLKETIRSLESIESFSVDTSSLRESVVRAGWKKDELQREAAMKEFFGEQAYAGMTGGDPQYQAAGAVTNNNINYYAAPTPEITKRTLEREGAQQ